jgi:hypothetical protein
MREAELAALSDEFFEAEFTLDTAVGMLGSPVSAEEVDGRQVTYLRPDARSLARIEVFVRPPDAPEGEAFLEDMVLVLRGPRVYSRATLEEFLGPSTEVPGPLGEEGEASLQLEFTQARGLRGVVIVRRWVREDDDEPSVFVGEGEVRADEVQLRRFSGELTLDSMELAEFAGAPAVPLDEAMDVGVWIADLAWKVLRFDFDLARAQELFGPGAPAGGDGTGTGRVVLTPHDARLGSVVVTVRGAEVVSVRIEPPHDAPLFLAVGAVADRLNAAPSSARSTVRFRSEATRSRGAVALALSEAFAPDSPIVGVRSIEVVRS